MILSFTSQKGQMILGTTAKKVKILRTNILGAPTSVLKW